MIVFLVTIFADADAISAVAKTEKKLRPSLAQYLGKLGDDQHMYAALYYVVYHAITFSLLILLLFSVFSLQQLLLVAIWGCGFGFLSLFPALGGLCVFRKACERSGYNIKPPSLYQ